jgi:hypothetical protein
MPGSYTVKLSAGNQAYTQTFTVKMDPRVKSTTKDLQLQHDLSVSMYNNIVAVLNELQSIANQKHTGKDSTAIGKDEADEETPTPAKTPNAPREQSLRKLNSSLVSILNALQESDVPPTQAMIVAAKKAQADFEALGIERKK